MVVVMGSRLLASAYLGIPAQLSQPFASPPEAILASEIVYDFNCQYFY